MSLIDDIKQGEGFVGMPYKDSLGYDTIGYGTKLPLTKEEAELLLKHRLVAKQVELNKALEARGNAFAGLPEGVHNALYEMTYQMGVPRVMGFKRMLGAIHEGDWQRAHDEALNSKWAGQTPERAKRVAGGMLE